MQGAGMKLVGIDPGKTGSIVEIEVETKTVRWMDLPYREDTVLDGFCLKSEFNLNDANYIFVEKVHSMKVWGAPNNFTFGYYYGQVRSFLEPWPYNLVPPQTWQKKVHSCIKTDTAKKMSAAAFRRMNPGFEKIGKKHEGLIDAFFIAYYAGIINHVSMPLNYSFHQLDHRSHLLTGTNQALRYS
jgi:hypothetical protein